MDTATAFGITAPTRAWREAGFVVFANGDVREERFGAYADLMVARLEHDTGNDLVLARVLAMHRSRNDAAATRHTVEKLAGAMHHLAFAVKKGGYLAEDVRAMSTTLEAVTKRLGINMLPS